MHIEELIIGLGMVVATTALVGATIALAFLTRQLSQSAKDQTSLIERQTDILSASEERAADREKPRLLLSHRAQSIGLQSASGYWHRSFEGFNITNGGSVDVKITGVGATFATRMDDPDALPLKSIDLAPRDWQGIEIEGSDLPVTLTRGEIATYLFEGDGIDEIEKPIRWFCQDSQGAVYYIDDRHGYSDNASTNVDSEGKFLPPDTSNLQIWVTSRIEH